jgi:hypothetical protein
MQLVEREELLTGLGAFLQQAEAGGRLVLSAKRLVVLVTKCPGC